MKHEEVTFESIGKDIDKLNKEIENDPVLKLLYKKELEFSKRKPPIKRRNPKTKKL